MIKLTNREMEILHWLKTQLEIKRTGEVPRKAKPITLLGKELGLPDVTIQVTEISEDYAKGFTEGKNFALSLVEELIDGQKIPSDIVDFISKIY